MKTFLKIALFAFVAALTSGLGFALFVGCYLLIKLLRSVKAPEVKQQSTGNYWLDALSLSETK